MHSDRITIRQNMYRVNSISSVVGIVHREILIFIVYGIMRVEQREGKLILSPSVTGSASINKDKNGMRQKKLCSQGPVHCW
jgi:hypothetical protein